MSWNRWNDYDNDDFGEACDRSESNILPVDFSDFKQSVVKKCRGSVEIKTKDEEKLLNTFVNVLDESLGTFAGNNVVRNLNREGVFNDSDEKKFNSFFGNGKREDNLNSALNRNKQNTGNTIYNGNREAGKARTGVKTDNGKYKYK